MDRKHIGLIYAGGTVGMAMTAQGYAPMPGFSAALAALLTSYGDALPDYTLHAYPAPIDSANATPKDWQTIARDIAARYQDYDGFVVLHGTDTMAYTAAALSFMLQGLRKPVIVTGSQIPLSAARSDAPQNLAAALQLAASDAINEVTIYFNGLLLRGNRATKTSTERMAAFDSPNYPPLAEVGIQTRLNMPALLPRAAAERFALPDYGTPLILPLRFVPGLPAAALRAMFDLDPAAVVLQCYGAGNAPDRDPALLDMLARANERGTVVVACSQAMHGQVAIGTYAAGAGMTAAGVIGARDMTFEAVFAKLHHLLALGLAPDALRAEFLRDLSGELSV
ncbi:MAG TPA: type I asparaginase [Noviherbaspirillum sp.]|uniref:type I asparaginase n=1 Tax=Noviherbaspirillum sp. TaxID=1926288 RepID=UPI002D734CBC|nr:type I asparaginase [Noviherbaspirillum sp.]HYD97478.1 type I asparaginase [Noviherbaspirillum sp.]